MTAAAIALLSLVLAGQDQGGRTAGHCRAGLPVCAALLLAGCDDKPAKANAKADRSALAAGGAAFIVRVDSAEGRVVNALTMVQAASIIEKRLNPKGTRAVIVTSTGGNKLMVEVAGLTVAEAEATKPLVQKSGKLEFHLLGPDGREETTKEDTIIRPGYVKMKYLDAYDEDRRASKAEKYLWVKNKAELSGKSVNHASPTLDSGATNYSIYLGLHDDYGEKMRTITKANLGKPMAIIIDGEVISAPTIMGEFGKDFQITGRFTEAQALELATQLMNPLENPLIVEKITDIPPAAGK